MSDDSGVSSLTSVFLLTENRLLREALVRILSNKSDMRVVGSAGYTPSILSQVAVSQADVVLLDSLSLMFSGSQFASAIGQPLPSPRIVMIGMDRDEDCFWRAIREGVMGYVFKDASAVEILNVIRSVASGEAVCPPCFSRAMFLFVAQHLAQTAECDLLPSNGLSRREQQLVGLVRHGLTNKEIAARLCLSEQTIKNHIHRMLRKVGVRDRMAMVEHCSKDPNLKQFRRPEPT